MKIVNNCYECEYYQNIVRDNKISPAGICTWWDYDAHIVPKNQTVCDFKKPGRKLSLGEIKIRNKKEIEEDKNFMKHLERASEIVKSWPEWKRNMLSSYLKNE
jgi:hypothetical protein